jgi:hypothetical protein
METQNTKSFLDILKQSGAIGALLFIIFFFGNSYMEKFNSLQKELMEIKL